MGFPSHVVHTVPKIESQAAVLITTLSRAPNQEVMRVRHTGTTYTGTTYTGTTYTGTMYTGTMYTGTTYTGTTRNPKVLSCPSQVSSAVLHVVKGTTNNRSVSSTFSQRHARLKTHLIMLSSVRNARPISEISLSANSRILSRLMTQNTCCLSAVVFLKIQILNLSPAGSSV